MDERKEAMKIKEMKGLKETAVRKVVAVEKRVGEEDGNGGKKRLQWRNLRKQLRMSTSSCLWIQVE
jgi:hypothetical protein